MRGTREEHRMKREKIQGIIILILIVLLAAACIMLVRQEEPGGGECFPEEKR